MPGSTVDEFQKRINQIKGPSWGSVVFFRCFMFSLQSGASNKIDYFISTPTSVNLKTNIEIELKCS